MSFSDLEKILKTLFQTSSCLGNSSHKANLKNLCLSTLSAQKMPWWKAFLLGKFSLELKSAFALVFVFGFIFSLFQNQSYAGDIQPTFGLVELTRDGKTRIIREKTKLKVGDIVQVASSAQAQILLNDSTIDSQAMPHTELRIVDKNKIFLSEGTLENHIQKNGEIATKRGKISANEAQGIISVTKTGETKITAIQNKLAISDWLDRSTELYSGETIKLTTDSNLSNTKSNRNESILTNNISNKVQAKLLITQTKVINAVHEMNQAKSRESGQKTLQSAEQSFKTIYSIITFGLNGKRSNLSQISTQNTLDLIKQTSKNKALIAEAEATFILLEKAKNEGMIFALTDKKQNKHFYKYLIIENIFSAYASEKVESKQLLQSKYIERAQAEFSELNTKSEQNAYISSIPQRTQFRAFIENLQE